MVDATANASRVLIVERDEPTAVELSRTLQSFGYRVVGSASGVEDAIRMAALQRPDLVLLELPSGDEAGAIEAARVLLHELHAAVVFMSTGADAATLRHAGTALPLGYLVKPIAVRELQTTVATALSRHLAEQRTHTFRARSAAARAARAERARDESQSLETWGQLAGGVAHDFNNLLSVILGHASLCAELAPPQSAQARSLEQIVIASERGVGFCNQLLAFAGKSECQVEPMDVNQCVEETVHLLRILIGKNASLLLDLEGGLPSLLVERSQIQRVIMNLVINAAEALGSLPGQITVRTHLAYLNPREIRELQLGRERGAGAYVVVEVADTGHGMDPETLRRIFDPFFTTKISGRGLGLAAVQGIVRGHKGALHVESEPGRGTSFHVLLPAEHAAALRHGEATAGDPPPS